MNRFLKKIDVSLLNWIERHARTKWMDRIMLFASKLGDWGVIWIAYALLFMCAADKRPNARPLFLAVTVCALAGNFVIKPLFKRTRPCNIDESRPLLLQRPSDSSFPSCHTMTSFAAVVTISQAGGIMGATSLIFAGIISFSRMYLFVHYPSDVLIGAIMGLAAGKLFV
jgi:undecaprenyl-diphosphatase